jgi:metal-responsive CopG/Arc/MetJ family transcriptional regulator
VKQIKLNLTQEVYNRLDKVRRKEAPSKRNKTFCRDLLESMITVFEEDYKKKEKKNVRKRPKTRKRSK